MWGRDSRSFIHSFIHSLIERPWFSAKVLRLTVSQMPGRASGSCVSVRTLFTCCPSRIQDLLGDTVTSFFKAPASTAEATANAAMKKTVCVMGIAVQWAHDG